MKVRLYILCRQEVWSIHWTIALSADLSYWRTVFMEDERTTAAFGRQASIGESGYDTIEGGRAVPGEAVQGARRCLFLWHESLPLGIAAEAAERWTAGSKGGRMAEPKAVRLLARAVEAASGSKLNDERKGDHIEGVDIGLLGEQHIVAAYGEGREEERKHVAVHEEGRREGRKHVAVHDEVVRAVADRLRGRAALLGEAQQLLAAGPPACQAAGESWSALSAALQLAALRGLVRLQSAVAPQPAASPLRRLLPAPLRRGGRRCLRCGSGEERMNRTACEACGSSACAYCEACLTMGRSRECGLLVLGGGMESLADAQSAAGTRAAPSPAAARAHGGRAPSAPDARWGLSPAQQAAASAALQYALPRLQASVPVPAPSKLLPAPTMPVPAPSKLLPAPSMHVPAPSKLLPAPSIPVPAPTVQILPPASQRSASSRDIRPFLLWAVTGAGKTEMVFPLIEAALAAGGRALVATPRRDVVLELDPRIRRAFPDARVVTLYGGSEQRWEDGDIILATTHQLFRFHEYFQLVIVDELDAFPYHGDPRLQYAAAKASVPGGAVILLTATPSRTLQLAARYGRIGHVRVPVRFHRHPLPVPRFVHLSQVVKLLARRQIPSALLSRLKASIEREAQCFVFVQQIRHAEPLARLIHAALPGVPTGSTSSKDEHRSRHVQMFRDRQLRILVTTTILERGVTVPHSDVFILDADGTLFDEASLVQMAGRAGRSKDDPDGNVYFFAPVRSRSQKRAVQQIKSMNREAAARGFLIARQQR